MPALQAFVCTLKLQTYRVGTTVPGSTDFRARFCSKALRSITCVGSREIVIQYHTSNFNALAFTKVLLHDVV